MTRILSERVIHRGYGVLAELTLETSAGDVLVRQVEHHGHAVAVLPYDPERRVAVLTRQARPGPLYAGAAAEILESPAGMIEDGDDPAETARREALEETGLDLKRLESLGAAFSSPGVCAERVHLFLAPFGAGDRRGEGGGVADEGERITVVELPLADLARAAGRGEIADLKTLALIWALRARAPELFDED